MGFAERVKSLRESADMTQEELAKRMDVSRPTVTSWESGKIRPRLARLDDLASLLGTTSYYLLNGDGPKTIEVRPTSATVPLQVLGVTCMGDGDEQEADAIVEVPEGVAMRHPSMFVVHGIGPCMSRRFPEDAVLGVDPSIGPRTGDVVLARDEAHGSFVHVYLAGSGGTVMLSADSWEEGFEDIVVGPRDPPVEVLGVVVWYQAYEDVRR
jgi:repressor LexA